MQFARFVVWYVVVLCIFYIIPRLVNRILCAFKASYAAAVHGTGGTGQSRSARCTRMAFQPTKDQRAPCISVRMWPERWRDNPPLRIKC